MNFKIVKGIFNKYFFLFLAFKMNFQVYFYVKMRLEEIFLNEISFNKDIMYTCVCVYIKTKLLKKLISLKETCII